MAAISTRRLRADTAGIEEAARLLRAGRLVALPTETVYGLGADAGNDRAVAAIFEAKGRPRFNPLIVHLHDQRAAEALAMFDDRARLLAERFWPGPLTMVLPRRPRAGLSHLVSAGLDTVALRVPSQPVARALLAAADCPVAAPSANRSGRVSPTTAAHVMADMDGRIDAVLDGGACGVGLESTVIDLSTGQIALLRPGGLALEDIESIIGPVRRADHGEDAGDADAPRAPGMLLRHYAPSIPLRLNVSDPRPGEALITFGRHSFGDLETANLSPDSDLCEAAANLFDLLHRLDNPAHAGIAVMPIPDTGLGLAINDRLRRAARGREPGSDPA